MKTNNNNYMTPICRVSEFNNLSSLTCVNFLVGSSTTSNEQFVFVMDRNLTTQQNSDKVRSAMAKLTGSKFTNARCRRLKM